MYRPDYGLQLVREGVGRDVDLCVFGCQMFSLTVLGPGEYSTFAERQHNGHWYAVSVDFDQRHLQEIIAKASTGIRATVTRELARDGFTPRTIEFDGEIVCDLRLRLGEPQRNGEEVYVPLVVQEVL